jgi:O-antigen/teichoic acid export membrane protein
MIRQLLFRRRVEVPESGKSYSDYAQNLSNVMNGMFFFAGFTFTVVAILLTFLPNPKALQSQLTLLFLTVIFYLTVFIASFFMIEVTHYVEKPQLGERGRTINALVFLTFLLIGLTFPLLFLLWDLTSLAAVSGLIWLVFGVSIFLFVFKRKIEVDRKRRADKDVSDKIPE